MKKIVLATKRLVQQSQLRSYSRKRLQTLRVGRLAECPSEGALRSLSDVERTRISFRNERFGRIYVFWIDYEGQRQLYRTLAPGQSQTFQTYATHPWVVTDASGNCLGVNFADVGAFSVRVH